uniref:calcium-binding protein n=1 Tax=unclassified Bradyrhizobium TaxID=2631580 RepID=UPI00291651FB
TIVAGLGDKYLNGFSGNDTYIYTSAGGNDVVDDDSGTLVMQDIASTGVTLSGFNGGNDVLINIAATGKTVTLRNELSQWNAGLTVTFADGVSWNRSQIVQMLASSTTIYGTSGADSLNLPTDGYTIYPGKGDDSLSVSGNGGDTIVFAKGDGHDVLNNPGSGYNRNDTLKLSGILPSEVALTRSGDVLFIDVLSSGDQFKVNYQFWGDGSQIQGLSQVQFADGTTWNRATIAANAWIRGTSGNDSITLPSDGITVDAGAGDDTFSVSGNGSDRIVFSRGDGHDSLTNPGSGYNRNDTLVLTDLLASDVQFTRNGNALVMTVPSTGDSFTTNFQFWGDGSQIQGLSQVQFADGTTWNRATIAANAWIRGTSGNDSITLPSDGITVDAGAGDDTFSVSGNGSDRIVFSRGDGHDSLTNPGSGYNRNDTLVLTDLLASDVQFTRNGNALVMTVPSTGDSFTTNFQFWGDGSQIQGLTHIQFADGSIWDRSAIADSVQTFTWTGSAANGTLNGNNYGSNIFQFEGGAETANGGARNNVYQASSSTGQATINLPSASTSHNELDFLGSITDQNLWFLQSGNDLKIDLLGTATSATVVGWFAGASNEMQEITAGGLKVDSQISQLVQAMATYAVNNPGFDPTSSNLQTVPNDAGLQNAITAAWHA